MAAGLLYFLITSKDIKPKYQISSYLSGVVMISAALILYNQQMKWEDAFVFDGMNYILGDATFSNGYRYVNWSIDVPMLLTQLLIVIGVTGKEFRRKFTQFVVAALLMIWTGYYGQMHEVSDLTTFYIWGAISTIFFIYINWIVGMTIFKNLYDQPKEVQGYMKAIFWLLIISWTLYPIAYLMPVIDASACGVVTRQYTFTIADISSKVIYGVLLGRVALLKSAAEGHEPAQKALS